MHLHFYSKGSVTWRRERLAVRQRIEGGEQAYLEFSRKRIKSSPPKQNFHDNLSKRQVQNSDWINSDRIGPDQLGPVRVGSGRINSDQQKINKLRNILNFYLIVGLIPLRNGPFTRHFDFLSFTVFTRHFVLLVPGQANV